MKKLLLSSMFAVAGMFGLQAQYNVTIYANLSSETVSPNGVHVAGSFQSEIGGADWTPGANLMADLGGGIYSFVASNLPNGVYEFKIVNGDAWGSDESSIPSICQVGGGNTNRFFVVDGVDITLPPVYFNGSGASDDNVNFYTPVRFSTDMGTAVIDPAGISARGDWQEASNSGINWQAGGNKLYDILPNDGLNIYTGVFYVPTTSTTFNYKFLNGANFEGVPTACANANGNRDLTIDATAGTSVLYCYGTCNSVCVAIPTYSLTLNVDMNYNCNFDVNSSDSVDIAGPYNNWGGGTYLTDSDNDGIYSTTIDVPAGDFIYKARIIKNLSPTWEGGANRVIPVSGITVAPSRCFGSEVAGACAPIPAPATITFRVDMTNETPGTAIYLKGDFTSPQWDGGAIQLTPTAGSPGFFETTVNNVCPGSIRYKFVNGPNFVADEEQYPAIGADTLCLARNPFNNWERVFVRANSDAQTLQYVYNTCSELTIGIEETKPLVVLLYPNPADNSTTIQFNNSSVNHTLTLSNLLGKQILKASNVRGSYVIERGNLASGVYFVQITDSKGQTRTQKLTFR